jgi:hypothetical protein
MQAMFADDSDLTTGRFLCRLDLRVMPSGEPPFKTRVHTRLHTLKSKGDMVPALYDPDDHDKLVVDYKADPEAACITPARRKGLPATLRRWRRHVRHRLVAVPLTPRRVRPWIPSCRS